MDQWKQLWVDQLNDHCSTIPENRLMWDDAGDFEWDKFCDSQTEERCRECQTIWDIYHAIFPKWEKFIRDSKEYVKATITTIDLTKRHLEGV